ncbi:hypothetical protein GCM10009807_21900 [Microbacterium lacus]|uniref:Uncharacterized protein n=1 Tax=Microbacterium lacus TaxID=415217 RepID=A0ABP4SSL8_9MICO
MVLVAADAEEDVGTPGRVGRVGDHRDRAGLRPGTTGLCGHRETLRVRRQSRIPIDTGSILPENVAEPCDDSVTLRAAPLQPLRGEVLRDDAAEGA